MSKQEYRIYTVIVYSSALLIGAALLLWEPVDVHRAAAAAGFLILHIVASVRAYRQGVLRW